MTVNKERVLLLVQALESGDYQQARAKLCKISPNGNKTYCCLGVAAEVAIANGLDITVTEDGVDNSYLKYNQESAYLPADVMAWYGFESIDPYVEIPLDDGQRALVMATKANDKYNRDLAEIAEGFRRVYLTDEEVPGGES